VGFKGKRENAATLQRMCADLGHFAFQPWTMPPAVLREFGPDAFPELKDALILLSEASPRQRGRRHRRLA